ncbi:MAG: hypothetical protein KDN18_01345 [Verrucomicrobiae bacterium]|nr:hypothetical protein [Verrucomicrobiae bacterium]
MILSQKEVSGMNGRGLEQVEAAELRRAVKEIEAMLTSGAALPNPMLLGHLLERAKNRIIELDHKDAEATKEEREKALQEVAVAVLIAQREAALNLEERRQFAEFLDKDHFTKADFSSLEKFYLSAWERLSEHGKAEMSHRVWEGVRRKEYEFSELPEIVKQKEAERLRDQLSHSQISADLQRIPEPDREDFIRAWDQGKRAEAYGVLDRPVFAENVATQGTKVEAEAVIVRTSEARDTAEREPSAEGAANSPAPQRLAKELSIGNVQLVDAGDSKPVVPTVNAAKEGPAPSEVNR